MSDVPLNRKVVLEAPVATADGAGGQTRGWRVLGSLWCAIESATGRNIGSPAGVMLRQQVRVTVRAAAPNSEAHPRAGQRFRSGDRLLKIVSVAESGSDARYLVCMTQEEVAP